MADQSKTEVKTQNNKVLILAKNVWADDVKWLQHDVVELSQADADLLCENKQGKRTKDDVTVESGGDNGKTRVEL